MTDARLCSPLLLLSLCPAHPHGADPHPLTGPHNIEAKFDRINANAQNVRRNFSLQSLIDDSGTGVDVSQHASEDVLTCMLNEGLTYVIVRAYQSTCEADPEGVHTAANAWTVGMDSVDIYLFPSFGCSDGPATQVDNAIAGMGSIQFGILWLDVEISGSGWSSDVTQNQEWLAAAIEEAQNQLGADSVGIYTSAYGWSQVMGDWTGASSLPLWYAHYDDNPSFSDFSSFGGWDSPSMKQFEGDQTVCSFGVDLNYASS